MGDNTAGRKKMIARFGGDNIGGIILGEGPGRGGFYSLPWALDEYERAMDLSPSEAWLLKRLARHAWEFGTQVYVSFRKVESQSKTTRKELRGLYTSLEHKGFIKRTGRGAPPDGSITRKAALDRRIRWDISNTWRALWVCIQVNPLSKLREEGYGWNLPDAKDYAKKNGFVIKWDELQGDDKRVSQRRRRAEAKEKAAADFLVSDLLPAEVFHYDDAL